MLSVKTFFTYEKAILTREVNKISNELSLPIKLIISRSRLLTAFSFSLDTLGKCPGPVKIIFFLPTSLTGARRDIICMYVCI